MTHPIRRIRHRLLPLAGLLLLLPTTLSAQRRGPFDDARRGEGTLERNDATIQLVEARVELRQDGSFAVEVASRDKRFAFSGTWTQADGEQRLMTVSEAMGDTHPNAEGWVRTKDGRLRDLHLVGRWNGGRRLALHFDATGDLPPERPARREVDSTRDGAGGLEVSGDRTEIRRARVRLAADGSAEIWLWMPNELRLAGRWSEGRSGEIRFETDGGLGNARGDGSGTIRLDGRQIDRIDLSGTSASMRYRIDFRGGATPPPPPPPPTSRPKPQRMTEEFGYDRRGDDYTSVYFDELRDCKSACLRDDRCLAYSYNTRDRICYLKDRVNKAQRNDEAVTGVKTDAD